MNSIYEKVRELVKDPQHGSLDYGRLGSLPMPYRHLIHELCDYAEVLDKYTRKQEVLNLKCARYFELSGKGLEDLTEEELKERTNLYLHLKEVFKND